MRLICKFISGFNYTKKIQLKSLVITDSYISTRNVMGVINRNKLISLLIRKARDIFGLT